MAYEGERSGKPTDIPSFSNMNQLDVVWRGQTRAEHCFSRRVFFVVPFVGQVSVDVQGKSFFDFYIGIDEIKTKQTSLGTQSTRAEKYQRY